MDKVYTINGGMFDEFRIIFANADVARQTLRAYANFLKFRQFEVRFTSDDSFTFDGRDNVWVSEFSTAHEVPSILANFVTD